MAAIVHAIYTQGKIELLETPVGIRDGKVRVIVIEEPPTTQASRQMQYGKYRSGAESTEEDFKIAEWHEPGWGIPDGE